MPNIDLSILNQRQTPAFYADVFANRPAAGYVGRIFVSTDTFAFYRDNGTGWDLIGGPGTGTVTGSGASGQIALWSGASTIVGDTGLTYDGTGNSLTASKFIVTGGTSSQFLKADGSVDSSSYVPYTGATASLVMGANNILAQNYYVDGNGTNSGGFLGIKQYSGSSSGTNGYTSISALTQNSLYFQFSQTNGTNKTFELSTALLGTTIRQYQVPNADGTIALTSNIPSVSGTAGQIAYFNGSTSITGDNGLFYDSVNDRIGIGTITPGAAIDAHSSANIIAQLNQTTATNNSLLAFQNSGAGLWRIGNFYNGGANDLGIFDVIGNIQPVTVKKTTGQVLIGTSTVGSGKLVVASASGDNGIQIVGASAPSLRIDSAESGPTKRAGLGISTATNNFIQGSADRDFCIFNGSTAAASPILFGVYDAGAVNVQEAARITATRNFNVGSVVDSGFKTYIKAGASGLLLSAGTTSSDNTLLIQNAAENTTLFNIKGNGAATFSSSVGLGVNSGLWDSTILPIEVGNRGGYYAGFNGAAVSVLYIGTNSYYNAGWKIANTSIYDPQQIDMGDGNFNFQNANSGNAGDAITWNSRLFISSTGNIGCSTVTPSSTLHVSKGGATFQVTDTNKLTNNTLSVFGITQTSFAIGTGNSGVFSGSEKIVINDNGNICLGTSVDAGQKLQVNGTATIKDTVRVNASTTTSVSTTATIVSTGSNTYGGIAMVWGNDAFGNIFSDLVYYCLSNFNVLASQSVSGVPQTRTYSVDVNGNLLLAMGALTYTVRYQGLLTT